MEPLVYANCQFCGSNTHRHLHTIAGFKDDPRKFRVVACEICGLVFINPRYSEQANLKLYEESYYTDQVKDPSGVVRNFISDKDNKIIDHLLELGHLKKFKKNGRILDFGSGPGFFLEVLDGAWEKYAVDISDFAIKSIQNPAVVKSQGSLLEAGFNDDFFDAIYIGHTLDRLTNLKENLKELRRILKPDGIILVVTPNIDSMCARVFKGKYRLLYANHLIHFSPSTVRMFLDEAGFRVLDVKYPFFSSSVFTYSGFFLGTVKILLQGLLNILKIPWKMLSPPYHGNIMSIIVSKNL